VDINGTRFHLLLSADDWAQCTPVTSGTIDLGDGARLKSLLFQFPAPASESHGDPLDERRGAGRDRYGNWYWIDDTRARVQVRSVGSNELGVFWPPAGAGSDAAPPGGAFGPAEPPAAPIPCRFGGLAVTDDHYLIVGTLDQPGLLVFDLHAGGLPRHLRWPASVPFQPFDLAPRPTSAGGGVFVLDHDNGCYWALDRQLGVVDPEAGPPPPPDVFRAVGDPTAAPPAPPPSFPSGVSLAGSSPVAASDPVAIEALPDGTVLILDRQPVPQVHRYRRSQLLSSSPLDLGGVLDPSPPGPPALGADLAFLAGAVGASDRLFVPAASGEQVYAFTVSFGDGAPVVAPDAGAPFFPMRLYGGKGLVAVGGGVYYDFDDQTWLSLVQQRRPRFEREGTFDTPAFDGVDPGCVWHRLLFDGCMPATPSADVTIWSRTADEKTDLERAAWFQEPAPRRRPSGSELPLVPTIGATDLDGTFELLFQRARGRWLQLRIRLRGDGRTSPRLRALRVWYPRFSYLSRYLPATYRDDAESASFLDRFLANLEGLFTSVEDRMAVVAMMFDARTASADGLDWLAAWFGVALDPTWTEAKRRLFLRHAMDFFRVRGTVRGLQMALRLVIDDCVDDSLFQDDGTDAPASIRIVEWFRLRDLPPLALGDPSPTSGIRQVSSPPAWTPEQGAAALLALYRSAASAAGFGTPVPTFPVFEPGDGTAPLWHRFLRDVLSLSTTAGPEQTPDWRTFLGARYPALQALNDAWGTAYADVGEVPLPAVLPQDPVPLADWYQFQLGGGRFIASRARWIPAQGRAALEDRWHQAQRAGGLAAITDFPLSAPDDATTAAIWSAFVSSTLGFVPASDAVAEQAWRDFLARRYRRIAALNLAHGGSETSFDTIALPDALPADGAALRDWYDLQSIVLAARRVAHRFTVLLPVPAREAFALDLHNARRALAKRIIDLEKPAHTLYDIKFYWAMFRVGEARLEVDTLLDQSSRAPELMPPVVLDQAFLSESRLAATPPERETERQILGTASLRSRPVVKEKRS
jgi:phage tail-like protein